MKNIIQSKTIWAALILFIIGLEQYVPLIQQMVPDNFAALAAIILPAIIAIARYYGSNVDLTVKVPSKADKNIDVQ